MGLILWFAAIVFAVWILWMLLSPQARRTSSDILDTIIDILCIEALLSLFD